MLIYLIRHGETPWNKMSRIQGRENIALSEEGLEQAARCADAFRDRPLAAVLTSPLARAVQTAELVAAAAAAPVITEEALIERDYGSASGKVIDIFHPERYADDMEPLETVAARMIRALRAHGDALQADFAAVSHGGSINAVLRELSGGEYGSGKTRLKNACVNVLRYEGGTLTVLAYNRDAGELAL